MTRKFEEIARREDSRKEYDPLIKMANEDPELYKAIADTVNEYSANEEEWKAKRGGKGGKAEDKPTLDLSDIPEDLKPLFQLIEKKYGSNQSMDEGAIEKMLNKILDKRLVPVETRLKARDVQDADTVISEARSTMKKVHLQETKQKLTDKQVDDIEAIALSYNWNYVDPVSGKNRPVIEQYRRAYREYFLDETERKLAVKNRKEAVDEFTGMKKRETAGGSGNVGNQDPYRNADGTIDRDRKISDRIGKLEEKEEE